MENNSLINNDKPIATQIVVTEQKKCKCCGKLLPITYFNKKGIGHRKVCISCERNEAGVSDKFKEFTSRELIEELKSRGYKGELKHVKVEIYKL